MIPDPRLPRQHKTLNRANVTLPVDARRLPPPCNMLIDLRQQHRTKLLHHRLRPLLPVIRIQQVGKPRHKPVFKIRTLQQRPEQRCTPRRVRPARPVFRQRKCQRVVIGIVPAIGPGIIHIVEIQTQPKIGVINHPAPAPVLPVRHTFPRLPIQIHPIVDVIPRPVRVSRIDMRHLKIDKTLHIHQRLGLRKRPRISHIRSQNKPNHLLITRHTLLIPIIQHPISLQKRDPIPIHIILLLKIPVIKPIPNHVDPPVLAIDKQNDRPGVLQIGASGRLDQPLNQRIPKQGLTPIIPRIP